MPMKFANFDHWIFVQFRGWVSKEDADAWEEVVGGMDRSQLTEWRGHSGILNSLLHDSSSIL